VGTSLLRGEAALHALHTCAQCSCVHSALQHHLLTQRQLLMACCLLTSLLLGDHAFCPLQIVCYLHM
jgi:hypothetical protein